MLPSLIGSDLSALERLTAEFGERPFRARQIFRWLYAKRARTFEEMTDLSPALRARLGEHAVLRAATIASEQISHDGTRKFLFRLADRLAVESVLIPSEAARSARSARRRTVCVSTQVGCALDCVFCATGAMKLTRNLTAGEIVDQVIEVERADGERATNVVFMGMGEPLQNYDATFAAIDLLAHPDANLVGAGHMTVSTAGLVPGIRQMADEKRKAKLAVSLHTLDADLRRSLMPIAKKYGLDDLLGAIRYYYEKTGRRPTLEYILFDGLNDTPADSARLGRLAARLPLKVNIIPFHPIAFARSGGITDTLRPSPPERIEEFAAELRRRHVTVMLRSSSGRDIDAACGQLALKR